MKPLPWQGHLNLRSLSSQFGVQPRCVQVVLKAYMIGCWLSLRPRMTQAPTSLNWSETLFSSKELMSPARNVVGGSDKTLGNRKRSVPRNMAAIDAANVIQAMVIHWRRKPRRLSAFAGGLGGTGFAGAGGAVLAPAGATAPGLGSIIASRGQS